MGRNLLEESAQTSASLLFGLRSNDAQAWARFSLLFGPVLYMWARSGGLSEHDAGDVVQEVYRAVFTSFHRFRKELPGGRFRDWLWTIARRRICDHFRSRRNAVVARGGSDAHVQLLNVPDHFPADEPDAYVTESAQIVRKALELVRGDFKERTWQACILTVCEGRLPADVAAELGMSVGAVYVARSRVLKRIESELSGLM